MSEDWDLAKFIGFWMVCFAIGLIAVVVDAIKQGQWMIAAAAALPVVWFVGFVVWLHWFAMPAPKEQAQAGEDRHE